MSNRSGDKEIFLTMELRKSGNFREDKDFFYFDVEASNQNLDFEGQSVLQRALLGSKDYFLSNGVVSKDHLHKRVENGRTITDESYIIGEPVRVYTDGKSTRVEGRLYKSNEWAKKFIDLLKAKSTRIKASVGGMIPKVVKNVEDGTEKVVSVLWNDLALTVAPVNYTVRPATGILAKSLTSAEFVDTAKALGIGYGTNSSGFTDGRAMTPEDIEHKSVQRTGYPTEEAVAGLIAALAKGEVRSREEATNFLESYGIDFEMSHDLVREIISKHSQFMEVIPMAKKSLFAGIIDNIKKSMGGGKAGNADDDDDIDQVDDGGEADDDEDDNEEFVDAEEVIKALTNEVEQLKVGQEKILAAFTQNEKFQKSIGEGMIGLMQAYEEIAKSPLTRKGTSGAPGMNKGGLTGKAHQHRQFRRGDLDELRPILTKAVADGELSLTDCGKIETQINKSILSPNFQIDPNFAAFLEKKLAN